MEFLSRLFDTSDFLPRWICGNWSRGLGWLHILSDLGIWAAYLAIPLVLGFFLLRRSDLPFRRIFLLFGAFILACGTTHLMAAVIFWWPAYRLDALIKLFTALVSWATVFALFKVVPMALTMRSPKELEREVLARERAEEDLRQANLELELRVKQRTVELTTANAELFHERELLRTTLESIGDGVIATNTTGQVTFLNPVAETLTGWPAAEARGVPLETIFHIVNESSGRKVENPAVRALREGVIVGLANHTVLIARDGTERPIDDSAAPIRDGSASLAGAVLVFRDISERKREERARDERNRLTALRADVGNALAATQSVAGALRACCEALVRHLNVAFARLWTLNEAAQVLELQASAGLYTHLDGPHSRVPVGQFKIGRIASSRQPHLTNDVPNDPNVSNQEWARREGMVAFAGYPLLVEGHLLGVLAMFARIPLTEGVLNDLQPLAEVIAQFLDRQRAEQLIQQRGELLRVTLASIGDAVLTTDAEGRVNFLNGQAQELTGWSQEEAAGQTVETVFRIYNESTGKPVENPVRKVLQEGVICGLANHTILLAKDGVRRPIDDSGAPIRDRNNQLVGVVLVFRDVSERRRQEQRLREGEQRLTALIEAVPQLVWSAEPTGGVDFVNRRWYDYTGLTPVGTLGDAWAGAIHPDDVAKTLQLWQKALATGTLEEIEYRLRAADGSYRWQMVRGMPLTDESGQVVKWFGTVTDIHDRRQADEERQKFVSLAENSTDFIGIFDLQGKTRYINQAGQHLAGLGSLEEVQHTTLADFILEQDRQSVQDNFLPTVLRTGHGEIEVRFRHFKTDQVRWMLFNVFTVADGLATVSRDITERREMEDDLRRLAADLSEADRRKDEFLATLAHELRNPLAPIRNGLQVLRMAGNNLALCEQARGMMDRQLGQMVRLVDDLLDVCRINRNKLELRRERVELTAIVRSAVETSRPLIEANGHEFTVTLPAKPIYLDADVTRLAQVFSNLLNNAAKYTERGGRVWLTAELQGKEVVVSVKDTGVGIPPEMLPKVFEMFTQVDRTLERAQGGLGIGLTLVQRLVGMHNGKVEARSEGYGHGSEFVVRLPVVSTMGTEARHQEGDDSNGSRLARRRILVVDDSLDSAKSLTTLLELLGNEVVTAHDGLAAVEATASFKPEVILLDIGLPRLNGYEACRRIREQPGGKDIVIVAQTGWGQDNDRRRSQEAGFNFHLVKPVDPAALERLLANLNTTGVGPS